MMPEPAGLFVDLPSGLGYNRRQIRNLGKSACLRKMVVQRDFQWDMHMDTYKRHKMNSCLGITGNMRPAFRLSGSFRTWKKTAMRFWRTRSFPWCWNLLGRRS